MKRLGRTAAAGAAIAALLFACTRDYESPYLPGSPGYAGDEWTRDGDGDGVADSVAKYAPECDKAPGECIENAKVLSRITAFSLYASDMIIPEGSQAAPPRLTWDPEQASLLGYGLSSSDTAKVRIRDGLLEAVGAGNAQVSVAVPGRSRMTSFLVKVVAKDAKRVSSISARDLTVEAGREAWPELSWNPADADHKEYRLSIDEPSVGWPDGSGALKAIFPGTARVTVEALDGGHKTAFVLKVTDAPQRVEAVSVSAEDMYLVAGDPAEAPVILWNPSNVTEKRYLLAPADTNCVGVEGDRQMLRPKAEGKTQVSLYTLDGGNRTAWFTVYVAKEAVKVQGLMAADMNLTVGSNPAAPRLTWLPAEATNRKYTLESDSPQVASAEGAFIRPNSLGRAFFRATTEDGGFHGDFVVNVLPADTAIHVDSVRATDMSITVGFDQAPVLSWYPMDAPNQAYTLSSSAPAVASVAGGMVRGESAGSAVITVTAADGGKTTTFKVTVAAAHIPVQKVSGENMDMVVGETESPALNWLPGNATDLSYALTSLNTAVVRVVDQTTVEALAVGSAQVVVKSKDGPGDTLLVTVQARAIEVTGIAVAALAMNVGDADRDVAPLIQWQPLNATDKTFKLVSSSNTSAALIVDNKLRAVASGSAQVTIESQDKAKLKDTFTVTVKQPVKGVTVRDTAVWPASPDIDPAALIAWNPANADNKGYVLHSLDTLVAAVVNGTLLRPKASGAANVILRSLENTARFDTFKVTVKVPVQSLTIRDTTVYVGMRQINPGPLVTWNPSNASDKNWFLLWAGTASNTVVDSVTWRFNAVGPGKVSLIYVSSQNPAARATFQVTVIQPVASIAAGAVSIRVGDPDAVPAIAWTPANASDKGFTLSGGTAGIATVLANKVHAEGPGVTTMTARSNDGGKTSMFTVTVTQPVASIAATNLNMRVGDADASPAITWSPANASDKGYTLTGGAPGIAVALTSRGAVKVHAEGPGVATFTVKSNDGAKTATFSVTVTQPVVSIMAGNIGLTKGGDDVDPVITWTPANASNKGYTLSGGNPAIATVVGNRVHPVGGGSTTFTVTTADGAKTATFTATVAVPVAGVSCEDFEMRMGDADVAPSLAWFPADATNRGYTLASSHPDNAAIVEGTKVRAVSRGQSTITVTTNDGQKKGFCTVEVRNAFGF